MTPTDESKIRLWAEGHTDPLTLTLLKSDTDVPAPLATFGELLSELVPTITVKQKSEDGGTPAPSLALAENLRFQAAPEDRYLTPFLEALTPPDKPTDADAVAELPLPARLTLFIAHGCPHCPQALARILPLAHANHRVDLTVVDAALFADQAAANGVQSVPTLILDDAFRWTGTIDVGEVADMMRDRDPVKLGAATLRQTIESGDADQLAKMMADRGALFPAIIDLLAHPRWAVRLGAMVVMESLAEYAPALAESAVPDLVARLDDADASAQGDLVCTLGTVGTAATIEILNPLTETLTDPEVKEAIAEAIESIQLRL